MWIWREKYEALLWDIKSLDRDLSYHRAEADGATRLLMRVEDENRRLSKQVENERQRAENAIDELLKIKTTADPVSPENYVRQRMNPAEMDNVFEEEDENAVKRMMERADDVGIHTVYSEALEEQND